jgi:hypothetical protein
LRRDGQRHKLAIRSGPKHRPDLVSCHLLHIKRTGRPSLSTARGLTIRKTTPNLLDGLEGTFKGPERSPEDPIFPPLKTELPHFAIVFMERQAGI